MHVRSTYLLPTFPPQGILTQFGACCTWHARCGAPCFINLAPDLPVCALACLIRLSPVHALFFNSSPGYTCWLVSLSDLTTPCWTTRPGREPKSSAARQPSSLPIVKEPTPNGSVLRLPSVLSQCLPLMPNPFDSPPSSKGPLSTATTERPPDTRKPQWRDLSWFPRIGAQSLEGRFGRFEVCRSKIQTAMADLAASLDM